MIGIYKIENLINQKIYIGQSVNLNSRWNSHKNAAFNANLNTYDYPLYKAIRKYGIENFQFSIIEECSESDLDEKERYWISYYHSFGSAGYNQTPGGRGKSRITHDEVIRLFNNGYNINDLCQYFNVQPITITNILHPLGLGYLTQLEKNKLQPTCRAVEQYDLKGNLLNTYFSARNAAIAVGSNRSTIQSACVNNRICKNYIWKFQDDPITIEEIINIHKSKEAHKAQAVREAAIKKQSKAINQYDLTGKYIKTFPSAAEAAKILKIASSGISRVCRGGGKTAGNYIWKYVSDNFPANQDLILNKNIGGGG